VSAEAVPSQTFAAEVEARPGGGVAIRVPFDPSAAWGAKDRRHVAGNKRR
jgi:hypothetical protein